MTRIDCVARLKSAVQSVAEIDTLFFKVWQASGGTVTATCPHGIVYAVNNLLRAESPRDIRDIILSMRYPPNIVISDIPHMVAAHVNKRSPNFFNPNAGRVTEPTEENIKLVCDNNFRRKQVALSEAKLKGTGIHPLTLAQRYSLYDKFHEGNTKHPK